jgi:high-affinity iron transporter
MKNIIILCLTAFLSSFLYADDAPRLVVHLLDYLAKDYAGAVSENGQILSESEYAEQREFAELIVKTVDTTPALATQKEKVRELERAISSRAAPSLITPLARAIQQNVVQVTGLVISPRKWPDLKAGAELYARDCVICHGPTGAGDGPGAVGLDPPAANFRDPQRMAEVAPLGAFNTIRLGVPGTGMPPFPAFSDEQVWALAFYVVSLHHVAPSSTQKTDRTMLEQAATLPDSKLLELLGGDQMRLSSLRTTSAEHGNTLELAMSMLKQTNETAARGDWASAKELALKAYLEGIEPVEPRLKGLSADLLPEVETAYSEVRDAVNQRDMGRVEKAISHAQDITRDVDLLIQDKKLDPRLAFFASSGILLREGFEAALLIISLLSVIRATGFRRAAYWVHGGWLLAVLLGLASWFLIGIVFDISGAQRELLEGGTSLLAVVILLSVGFWLHKHSEIERWTRFLKEKVQHALDGKNLLALAVISFLAVFREALETVLFLRVLWLDADASSRLSLLSGVGATGVLVIAAAWFVLHKSTRLPVAQIFKLSSFIMAVLAIILTGKGVHALQESGLISEHPIFSGLSLSLLGIYPDLAVIISQVLVLGLIVFFWQRNAKTARGQRN